jgi:hypothetical protein
MSRVFYKYRIPFHDSAKEEMHDESFDPEIGINLLLLVMVTESATAL